MRLACAIVALHRQQIIIIIYCWKTAHTFNSNVNTFQRNAAMTLIFCSVRCTEAQEATRGLLQQKIPRQPIHYISFVYYQRLCDSYLKIINTCRHIQSSVCINGKSYQNNREFLEWSEWICCWTIMMVLACFLQIFVMYLHGYDCVRARDSVWWFAKFVWRAHIRVYFRMLVSTRTFNVCMDACRMCLRVTIHKLSLYLSLFLTRNTH